MPPGQNASQKKMPPGKMPPRRMPPGYFVTRKKWLLRKKVISTCKHVTYETYNV